MTVGTRAGYSGARTGRPTDLTSLVWPTDEGGWAGIWGYGVTTDSPAEAPDPADVLAEQLSVAQLVRFGRFGSPDLPFRLGWLPNGVSVGAVQSALAVPSDTQRGVTDQTFGSALFSDGGPAVPTIGTIAVGRIAYGGSFAEAMTDVVGPGSTELTVTRRPALLGPVVNPAQEVPVGAGPALFDARVLAVDLGDGSALLVSVSNAAAEKYRSR